MDKYRGCETEKRFSESGKRKGRALGVELLWFWSTSDYRALVGLETVLLDIEVG